MLKEPSPTRRVRTPHAVNLFFVRYFPDPTIDDFINIGIVLFDASRPIEGRKQRPLVEFTKDWTGLQALDANADVRVLKLLEHEIRMQLKESCDAEVVWRSLSDKLSNSIQVSKKRMRYACSAQNEIHNLARMYLSQVTLSKRK